MSLSSWFLLSFWFLCWFWLKHLRLDKYVLHYKAVLLQLSLSSEKKFAKWHQLRKQCKVTWLFIWGTGRTANQCSACKKNIRAHDIHLRWSISSMVKYKDKVGLAVLQWLWTWIYSPKVTGSTALEQGTSSQLLTLKCLHCGMIKGILKYSFQVPFKEVMETVLFWNDETQTCRDTQACCGHAEVEVRETSLTDLLTTS